MSTGGSIVDIDVRIRQHPVIEFLNAAGEISIRVNKSGATVDVSTVRGWVRMDVLRLHENAKPHTTEEIVRIGWGVLPHPPYSPDLAPTDFHLFGPVKEAHFQGVEAVKKSVRQWLQKPDSTIYYTGNMSSLKGELKLWKRTDYTEK